MKILFKKRLTCLLLAAAILLAVPAVARADYNYEGLTTPNVIVIDSNDMTASNPIYERAADQQLYPASTTKILTCILALENGNLDQEVTVGEEIKGLYELRKGYTENSSLMGLVEGETVTLRDLLYGLMLPSGNEAADAIAVAIGGSIENFVSMMNAKAAELGMTGSHFVNPNGVNHDNHYSTARDMAKLTAYALKNPQFVTICSTGVYTVAPSNKRSTELKLINSNFLITAEDSPQYSSYPYEYCIGVKTGRTQKAGSCLIAAAEKDGARAIVCLYGDGMDDNLQRFTNARDIFEDLFATVYTTISGDQLNLQDTFSCTIERARPEDLDANGQLAVTINPSSLTVRALTTDLQRMQANAAGITAEVTWSDSLSAPIRQGQTLGFVTYFFEGKTIFSTELTAPKDVLEVAVISSGSTEGDIAPTAGLLTTPSEPSEDEKTGLSPFLVILLAVLGVVILVVAVLLIAATIKQKRRRRRQQQRRQQQLAAQKKRSGTTQAQRASNPQRTGSSVQRSSPQSRPSGAQARSGSSQQRSRTSGPPRSTDRRYDGYSSQTRSGSAQTRRPQSGDPSRRRPQ